MPVRQSAVMTVSAPWLQEEQAEKAAAKVGRLKVTYERELEEVKIRRDAEIAQLNDRLLQTEQKSQEEQSRSRSEEEQLKAAMEKHSVRWGIAGGGELWESLGIKAMVPAPKFYCLNLILCSYDYKMHVTGIYRCIQPASLFSYI